MTKRASKQCPWLADLDAWLRPDMDWSLSDEYPRVFGHDALAFQHVIRSRGQLLAHAATLDLRYLGHGRELAVRLIGSVVVDPSSRSQGHGRALIQTLVEDFHHEGPDVLMLWSDKRAFYGSCGFEDLGQEHILILHADHLGPVPGLLRLAESGDVPALLHLHSTKPSRTRRRREDFDACFEIPRCETWVLQVEGEVTAYAILGRGLDFEGYIHEVGGLDPEVASLISALLMEKRQPLGLLLAPYRDHLRQLLLPSIHDERRTALGLGMHKGKLPPDFYLEGLDSI